MGRNREKKERIPFSSPMLNYMTYGGLPLGMSVEIYGEENAGKTSLTGDIVKNAQKFAKKEYENKISAIQRELDILKEKNLKSDQKKIAKLEEELESVKEEGVRRVLYVDAENTLDEDYFENTLGVDIDNLIISRPDLETAEQILQAILDLIRTGGLIAVVIDSVPCLVPQLAAGKTLEEKTMGGNSAVLTEFSKRIGSALRYKNTLMISINQQRDNMKNMWDQYHTTGGHHWKHLHSLRLVLKKDNLYDENYKVIPDKDEMPAGHFILVHCRKNKICKPDRKRVSIAYTYDKGFDTVVDLEWLAEKYGYIDKSGAWYSILEDKESVLMLEEKPCKFHGINELYKFLEEHPDVVSSLENKIYEEAFLQYRREHEEEMDNDFEEEDISLEGENELYQSNQSSQSYQQAQEYGLL